MATQVTLNSGSVDSAGSLLLKTNGTTTAVTLDTSQNASFAGAITATTSVTTPFVTSASATNLLLKSAGTTAVTIDTSQNVGIGVTSPAAYLSLKSAATSDKANSLRLFDATGTNGNNYGFGMNTTTGEFSYTAGTGGYHAWYTANTERMRIDTSGNLGLGVTPSAWGLSGQKVLQVLNASLSGYTTDEATVTGNAYHNGTGWRYIATNYAEQYTMSSGAHKWYTAPSGTAGNTITFTQAMTLDASGQLVIGATTANDKLEVAGTTSNTKIRITTTTGSNGLLATNTGGSFYFGIDDSTGGFYNTGTAYGRAVYSAGAYPMIFFTNATERARIDSSGRFYVGLTSPINGSQTAVSGDLTAVNGVSYQSTATTGTATYAAFYYNGTNKGTITGTSTAASYNTGASDYRLKENITDLTGGLEKINLLRPVSFTWIDSKDNDYGFIAHELQSVIPQAISGEKDAVDENGIPKYQSIFPAPAQMIATLVKAIQEQQTIITTLTDRITALEAK